MMMNRLNSRSGLDGSTYSITCRNMCRVTNTYCNVHGGVLSSKFANCKKSMDGEPCLATESVAPSGKNITTATFRYVRLDKICDECKYMDENKAGARQSPRAANRGMVRPKNDHQVRNPGRFRSTAADWNRHKRMGFFRSLGEVLFTSVH